MELVAWIQGGKLEVFEFMEAKFASWTKEKSWDGLQVRKTAAC